MNDTVDVNKTSCCMRKNPTYKDKMYDGVHANVALAAIYMTSFASGLNTLCIASFICFVVNSLYMYSIWERALSPENLDISIDSDDSQESSESTLNDEDDIAFNDRFRNLVEENISDDMPPLIPIDNSRTISMNPPCANCTEHYRNLIPVNNSIPNPYIPTFREITTPSYSHMLHDMEGLD